MSANCTDLPSRYRQHTCSKRRTGPGRREARLLPSNSSHTCRRTVLPASHQVSLDPRNTTYTGGHHTAPLLLGVRRQKHLPAKHPKLLSRKQNRTQEVQWEQAGGSQARSHSAYPGCSLLHSKVPNFGFGKLKAGNLGAPRAEIQPGTNKSPAG